jgi:hypothetical protein
MRDGRRLYLAYTIDDTEEGRPKDLSVTPLAEGQAYPDLDSSAGVYWYRPSHINEHLGLSPRAVPPKLNWALREAAATLSSDKLNDWR